MYREEDLYEEEGREHTCPHPRRTCVREENGHTPLSTQHAPVIHLKIPEGSEEGKDAGGGRCGKACGWSRSPDD